ncbi:30S ribosomal protein S6 [Salinarimonas chemoclinalis]|uniref:30S ribosomal protein S6 n=1 Tax=Salinarimonas chemoclinalis TaxID=3241599 RepID=UPI0035584084
MALYEHVFLARPDVTSQQVESMVETFKGIIEGNGGKVEKVEPWGLKTLAYRIKKSRKAHFTLLNIDAPHPAVAEMERQMRLSEDVLRFMTIKVEALDPEPSAMMQKRDRDDRGERGDRGDRGPRGDRDRGERGDRDRGERFGGERRRREEETTSQGEES